jgi:hypothetical protein
MKETAKIVRVIRGMGLDVFDTHEKWCKATV